MLSNKDKLALGELLEKYKKEYDAEVKSMEGKTVWDNKRKKHVPVKPKWGYLARSAREFYSNLKNAKHNDPNLDRAIKSASRAFQDLENLRNPESCPPKKKRASGGG